MGTRADFYIGRDEDAEWLGSIAWDGYPEGLAEGLLKTTIEEQFRHQVARFLSTCDDATLPDMGWPWPWETSATTDFAYAFDGGKVWASCFGRPWQDPLIEGTEWGEDASGDPTAFPDMSKRSKVQLGGKRSGLIVISAPMQKDE